MDKDLLTKEEIVLLKKVINQHGSNWSNKLIKPIKDKIKKCLRNLEDEECCYCQKDFSGEFSMVIDIEHILPKSKYKEYEFSFFNLNIACKKCNMNIKGTKTDFLVNDKLDDKLAKDPTNYKFIHPNFENYEDFIELIIERRRGIRIRKYKITKHPKAKYTYEYFKLKELERESFSKMQGVKRTKLSDKISPKIQKEIEVLLRNKNP